MDNFSYRTIAKPAEGLYKEKGSRFLAFAYPVISEGEVKERITLLEKEYFDARHHCFAWMLGADKKLFRAFDDGEPNHSAGDPILGQIRSKDLTNVLVVVVRYFGGVKLGVGGLISAYKLAAADALDNAIIVEQEVKKTIGITYEYSSTAEIMRLIKDFGLAIEGQSFEETCVLSASCTLKNMKALTKKLELMKVLGTINEFRIV